MHHSAKLHTQCISVLEQLHHNIKLIVNALVHQSYKMSLRHFIIHLIYNFTKHILYVFFFYSRHFEYNIFRSITIQEMFSIFSASQFQQQLHHKVNEQLVHHNMKLVHHSTKVVHHSYRISCRHYIKHLVCKFHMQVFNLVFFSNT